MDTELFLSEKELSVITDKDFLLAKAKIIAKIQKQFGQIRDEIQSLVESSGFSFPEKVDTRMGKISKGENYQQLPFVVLDYPKLFTDKSVFSFRTMFWWGNFFSITLHLGGKALENYRHNLIENIDSLKNTGTYICTNSTPWEYHYKEDNYVLIDDLEHASFNDFQIYKQPPSLPVRQAGNSPQRGGEHQRAENPLTLYEIIENKDFIKLSRKIELNEHKGVVDFCRESFSSFLTVLAP